MNLAKAAHNMQNLLTLLKAHTEGISIKLQCSAAKRELVGDEIKAIHTNVDRLSKLMASLALYKEVNHDLNLLQHKDFDLSLSLKETAREYQNGFPNILFTLGIPSGVLFRGDKEKLAVVFRNILENAVKYRSQKAKISLELKVLKGSAEIICSDNGIGIAAQDLSKIFLPFYRGRRGINDQGSGLGLAIAKEVVQFHGGDIKITSQLRKGTKVRIILPT